METYFFDTNGNLWMACSPDIDGAEAFGPSGASIQIDVLTEPGETPWSAAKRLGLVIDGGDDAFDVLVDGGLNAGNGEDPCCTFNAAAKASAQDTHDAVVDAIRAAARAIWMRDVTRAVSILSVLTLPTGDFHGSCDENAARSPWQAARFALSSLNEFLDAVKSGHPLHASEHLTRAQGYLSLWS